MIKYTQGDLLNSSAEALVNTVNTVGVMGKGIALQFKNRFPHNYKVYRDACKNGNFKPGELIVVEDGDLMNKKTIINFPTKVHWKSDSKYEYIISGLKALKEVIEEEHIKSIALPPLGCGNGGLDWNKVKKLIEESLKEVDAEIIVYTPNEAIKAVLQQEKVSKAVRLTPARAMLLYLLFQYELMGDQANLFVANKLAYFLQRSGEKLRLNFEAHHYGPYAVQLNHVLLHLNGLYLQGMEQNEIKPFEPLFLNYSKYSEIEYYINNSLTSEQNSRLNNVLKLVQGYESSFSLELLSTVDFISSRNKNSNTENIRESIVSWSDRKAEMFESRHIEIACKHLKNYSKNLF